VDGSRSPSPHGAVIDAAGWLFTARKLPGGFADGLRKWFEIHGRHSTVLELFLGVGYAPFIFSQQRFLALAQAIEVYHREAVGGAPLPRAEHRRRVGEISSAVTDSELAGWAESILREANRLPLAERVAGVIGRLGDLGREIVGDDEETFVRRVVQTRNHLTHLDQRVQKSSRGQLATGTARLWTGFFAPLSSSTSASAARTQGPRIRRNTRFNWFRSQLRSGG